MRHRLPAAGLLVLLSVTTLPAVGAWQLASRPADEWIRLLDAPERIASLKAEEIIASLRVVPGSVAADLGAGSGVFTVRLADAVGPTGKVYAVEIDEALVEYIRAKVNERKLSNVRTVLGQFGDPALPAADVDLAFMHDVLHHVRDRRGYLKQVVRYLKPAGRIAIVEPDAQKGPHRQEPALQVTKDELREWMADAGLTQTQEFPLFDDKWFVVYSRVAK